MPKVRFTSTPAAHEMGEQHFTVGDECEMSEESAVRWERRRRVVRVQAEPAPVKKAVVEPQPTPAVSRFARSRAKVEDDKDNPTADADDILADL